LNAGVIKHAFRTLWDSYGRNIKTGLKAGVIKHALWADSFHVLDLLLLSSPKILAPRHLTS
jgi:hypothetical protein